MVYLVLATLRGLFAINGMVPANVRSLTPHDDQSNTHIAATYDSSILQVLNSIFVNTTCIRLSYLCDDSSIRRINVSVLCPQCFNDIPE